ncbi:MAG: hypothetical protein A2Z19_01490 [Deltaproteobacteria bacterium RBG_16_54_18]|nr:MAG: hypothetical protein A2Z19_01490 [Deltaproteobacteria bacterium RBG_16_54_18]
MRKKVGTILDEELLLRVKQTAFLRRLPLSRVLEDALRAYLATAEGKKKKGVAHSTRGGMAIARDSLAGIMDEGGVYEA